MSHREIPDVGSENATAHEFGFIAEGLQLPPYQVSPYLPASIAQQRLDYRRLVAFVRGNCALERKARWYESKRLLLCMSKLPVEIAYLPPPSLDRFYLPAFEARFYFRDFASWFLYPLVLLVFTSLPALPFVMLTSSLYAVFLGRDPDEALTEILQ